MHVAGIALSPCRFVAGLGRQRLRQSEHRFGNPRSADIPATFQDDQDKPDSTPAANINWREYFADPHLPASINAGVANNYDL
ncbi:hypothetical protein [Methylomonas rivi]|uniref:Uncharacterized protein n=1 Tax=Methylomonas rivi TaxID=2952226 RepID=A0ABT1U4H1_9GAMM|nr:hypothetical protein [Methylomonas sp. WSC-6]MCQ8128695.1 hypothetical protein [Methylomonas sp. WSC-6]